MWRTKRKRLPKDDKLLSRYARLTAGQWARVMPTLMPFFVDHGTEISQARLTDEAEAVRQHSKKQSDKARARWLKTKETDHARQCRKVCRKHAPYPYPMIQRRDS
jgi:uncharacterized protein YdaU (DUF1376 family)